MDERQIEDEFDVLAPEFLLRAYAAGLFPMADPDEDELAWFDPDPRAIFDLDDFHVPSSVARVIRSGRFAVHSNLGFREVMSACAAPRGPGPGDGVWIDDRMLDAYEALHRLGHAHTIEAWRDGRLVGGLYGVHLGAAFFGESMFCRPDLGGTDASKVCLVHLVEHLRRQGFTLLDTQFMTAHLRRFGCIEVPRAAYHRRLDAALGCSAAWAWLETPAST